jgi:beta-galactosidase
MESWGKGVVWVNGHNLGRYWSVGPQQTLYLPAEWLKKGKNDIVVFEMLNSKINRINGSKTPILNKLQ